MDPGPPRGHGQPPPGIKKFLPPGVENQFVNIVNFELLLQDHPDQGLVKFVTDGLKYGFDIGFTGEICDTVRPNNKSARVNPVLVSAAVAKEVDRGHTAGPFDTPPFPRNHVSPIGAAPKPDGTCRLVLDLSQPRGESINDNINKEDFPCAYMHFDAATELAVRMGRGCLLSKIDIKHAYRLLPVRPEDWPLLVHHWDGCFYVDLKVPFGGRSSASIFTSFADLVCWVLNEKYCILVIHYSDDFLLFSIPCQIQAKHDLDTLKFAFFYLDIPIQEDKLVGPDTRVPYLGLILDTMTLTVSIPTEKVNEALRILPKWCSRRTCTLRELQSLNGKLNFYSKVIVPGRMFTRRLIDLTRTVSRPNHHVTLTREAKEDIQWWCEMLLSHNYTSMMPDPKRIYTTDLLLFTDAALRIGFGAILGNSWIQSRWITDATAGEDINFQELFAIMAATYTWGSQWAGKRIVFVTDNQSITQIWSSGTTSVPTLMSLVRKVFMFAALNDFSISLKHIHGHSNAAADALSRFQMERFRGLMPDADQNPTPIPVTVWDVDTRVNRLRASSS